MKVSAASSFLLFLSGLGFMWLHSVKDGSEVA